MGSPITFSGFNKIDFGLILDAVMEQEQAPLRTLQAQQKELESRSTTYRTLAGKLAAFETAVNALARVARPTKPSAPVRPTARPPIAAIAATSAVLFRPARTQITASSAAASVTVSRALSSCAGSVPRSPARSRA